MPTNLPVRSPAAEEAATLPPSSNSGQAETLPPRPHLDFPTTDALCSAGTQVPAVNRPSVPGYEILGELGRGGMGVVYKARQITLKRMVALKMILAGTHASAQDLARFQAEAEAVAHLQHPNIVQIHEVGEHEGHPYFSLEYIEGGSLAQMLDGTPLPARQAAHLVETLARAMQAAHQRGIIHRDLKPANVLLQTEVLSGIDAKGEKEDQRDELKKSAAPQRLFSSPERLGEKSLVPKITDFGLAKKVEGGSELTQTGVILGTPSYMAPEQAKGNGKHVGPAADVYALGAILYECLTGRPPFKAATALDTLMQVIKHEPVAPRALQPKVPRDLDTICLKCLQREPAQRYGSAEALAEDLRRFLNDWPIAARRPSVVERSWRWCRRHPGWALASAVAMVVLAGVIGETLWFNRRLQQQLEHTEQARQATQAANRDLQVALIRQAAERLDGDLRQLAQVPRLMAAALSQRSDWDEGQLEAWLRELLANEERVYGICVAFEPGQFQGARRDYALYVYREDGQLRKKLLLPPDYQPLYRVWDWYRLAREDPRWSDPYLDKGGGDVPMLTYSVPFFRQGKFVGVVTADLSIDYFRRLRRTLDQVHLEEDAAVFVVSRKGIFISHPDPRFQLRGKPINVLAVAADDDFKALARRMLQLEAGYGRAADFATGRPATFLFAPVPFAGWSFVAVIPDSP